MLMVFLNYLISFLITLVIETTVAFLFGYKEKKFILAVFAVNLFTHPLLNYILILFASFDLPTNLLLITFLEVLVIIAEAKLLEYAFEEQKFLKLSIIMNTVSYLIGLILFWV